MKSLLSRNESKILLLLLVSFVATGCGMDPFSQIISNKLKDSTRQTPSICPQAMATSALSVQSNSVRTRKVRIGRNDDGALSTMGIHTPHRVRGGTKLVATYNDNCLAGGTNVSYQDFTLEGDRDVDELEEEAQSNPCLMRITENFTYKVNMTSNDPDIGSQRHLDAIRASTGYDTLYHATLGITKTVVIAVIDSGVDLDHPDLAANVWHNTADPVDGLDNDGNGFVDDNEGWNFAAHGSQASNNPRPIRWVDSPGDEAHGTHVAGLAAAVWNNSRGGAGVIGKNVKIMAVNVFGDSSEGSTSRLNQGIRYAADNHADIINLSLGACGFDQTTLDTILYAICKGSTVVTAAGNTYYLNGGQMEGRELSSNQADAGNSCNPATRPATVQKYFQTPASFGASINGLVTVGSSDSIPDGSNRYSKSDFSGWSASLVEIAAPGSQAGTAGLLSTLPVSSNPTNPYGREEGTSMSTPVVAGALALAKSYADKKGVQLTPMNLERLLLTGSRHEVLLDGKVRNGKHLDLLNLANEIDNNINSYR